ncbi:hypothetical protein [Devosia sp. CN2-171]|uniref:hypothetical protein n=1 Tax=Devosia sp. CN2-171 TaxID=3400909 RepID=UPI003BF8705D
MLKSYHWLQYTAIWQSDNRGLGDQLESNEMYKSLMLVGDRIAARDYASRPDVAAPKQPRRHARKLAKQEAISDVELFLRNGGFSG